MPRVLISKHEYGPDSHKGALKDIPAPWLRTLGTRIRALPQVQRAGIHTARPTDEGCGLLYRVRCERLNLRIRQRHR